MSSRLTKFLLAVATTATVTGGLTTIASAATDGGGWVATHTHALHLTGSLLGTTPAQTKLEISVAIPLRNASAIPKQIESGQILTSSQVAANFGPTPATVQAVASYLKSQGFTDVTASTNGLLVTGEATVTQAQRAFNTTLSNYTVNGRTVYANTAPAMVPASLSGDVAAVLGLSDVPMAVPQVTHASTPDLSGFGPKAIENAYDAIPMKPASSTTTAIIASGDMTPTIAHLRYAEKAWGFSPVPVSVIYDGPTGGIVDNNPLTGNAEWDLDTQISTMVAKSVKQLDIYDVGTFTDPEVARGINMFVEQDRATTLSISLGECDVVAFLDGAMIASDDELAEGALQGQSSFASTGDNGYACPVGASTGVPEGPPGVSWPSDGEYTTAVGGTTLLADSNGNVSNEVAWVGGGGGISPWETAPVWTLQANPAGQSWQYTNQGGRSVPDVSAVADSTTPVLIYTSDTKGSTPEGVGGTSVSSPLTMGLWARIESAHANSLGLASYRFYTLYNKVNPATVVSGPTGPVYVPAANPSAVKGFRDITLGTNGGCVAKAGYDDCTGIGSLQAAALSGQL